MPTIDLDRKKVEKIVGKKLSDSELKEKISMFGTPLEGLSKDEIKLEIFPNRPDLLSEQGFGRAFASFLGSKKGLKNYSIQKSNQKVIVEESVKNIRPYTACAIVKGMKFDDDKIKEIIKIQEKLHVTYGRNRKRCAIGVYPLSKINFPVRYLAKKPNEILFMPLEGKKRMNGKQILEEHPTGKEYKHLLEGMDKYPLFIDDHGKVLSMPPIINSHDVGKVEEGVDEVFIECTGFNQMVLDKCLNMIVCALADMGGKIYSVEVIHSRKKITSPNTDSEKIKVDIKYVNKKLGLKLKENDLKNLLSKMGIGYSAKHAIIPPYRTDILHQIDIVEDIAIAYGYDNFKEEVPSVSTIGKEDPVEKFKNKVAEIMVGMNIDEVNSTHIVDHAVQTIKMLSKTSPVKLYNSLTVEYDSLRESILPNLLQTLQQNKINEYPQNIFEIGNVFSWDKNKKTETGILERTHIASILCNKNAGFTEIKQQLIRLCKLISVEIKFKATQNASFVPGRCAIIMINGKEAGIVGEVHPQVLHNFGLEMPAAGFEIDLNTILE